MVLNSQFVDRAKRFFARNRKMFGAFNECTGGRYKVQEGDVSRGRGCLYGTEL